MGSLDNFDDAKVVLLGAPMDFTVSFRPGARFGPQKIREVSFGLEEYSPYLDRDLSDTLFFDAGDLDLVFGDVQKSLKIIEDAADEIFRSGRKPLFLGGEHLITYPVIKSANRVYDDLVILHFDAHADLRDNYLGSLDSHASVIKRCADLIGSKNVYQFGIRSGTKEEFDWGNRNTNFFPFEVIKPLQAILPEISNKQIYLTIDIDVVDPSYACGTGTPEPGGCTPQDIFQSLLLLKDLQIIGMDVVEVSPVYDNTDRTAVLAAKIVREGMLSFLNA